MKTTSIFTITEEINRIEKMQSKAALQKSELDIIAENYANSILRFVYRKENYMECCGGMYYV